MIVPIPIFIDKETAESMALDAGGMPTWRIYFHAFQGFVFLAFVLLSVIFHKSLPILIKETLGMAQHDLMFMFFFYWTFSTFTDLLTSSVRLWLRIPFAQVVGVLVAWGAYYCIYNVE